MPSWQSYIAHPLLRVMVQRKLTKVSTMAQARAVFNRARVTKVSGVNFVHGQEGGVPGEWAYSHSKISGVMLYLHGGGYFACFPAAYRPVTGAFALHGLNVFTPAYRLAPEHPFPAAVEDALAAYRALLAAHSPRRIILAGDSAGGGLALALLLAARQEALPLPAGVVLFSPWTDLAITGASIKTNARRESLLVGARIQEAAELYLNGAEAKTPLASPLYGDLSGLPPVFIQASDREILLDDSVRVAEKIKAAQGNVQLQIWPNLPHVWQLAQSFLPEARNALRQAADFANQTLASQPPAA